VLRLAGLADRLAGDFASGEDRYASYSADLVSATEHLRALVSERGGEGRRVVELDVLAVRACGMVLIRAKERGIVLQAPAGSPLRAFGDERATLQILANLLTNAIKYTPGGGRVGVDVEAAGDELVKATVWDTGPGIPASDQARIFESFERLDDSGDDGAGLGLGISQRLARAMGGEIRIESSDARGTRVALLLPAA
jgi:signal transduction histidine kinase